MKLTLKTLQQKQFQIDAEPNDTVADLKVKIKDNQGHPIEHQKIIYSGKVLADDKSIESCQIKEKDFLVLMVSKPKAAPAAAASSSSATTPAAVPATPAPAAEPAPAPPAAPATPAAATAATPAVDPPAFGDLSSFVTGSALQTSINNMVDMGFERAHVLRALKASYNNPDRAVEYLMTGIPAGLGGDDAPAENAAPPAAAAPAAVPAAVPAVAPAQPAAAPQNLFQMAAQQQQQQRGPAGLPGGRLGGLGGPAGAVPGAGGAAGAAGDLEGLRGAQSLDELRQLIQDNPGLLQPVIQQFAQHDPALAQAVAHNPELLFQMLSEGMDVDDDEGEGGGMQPGAGTITLTAPENEAVNRLVDLGFTRGQALEAYLVCGKNEELAANYLFEGNDGN